MPYILAIDQGTSSTKSIIFDDQGRPIARGLEPLKTYYTDAGFAEQEPEAIYQNVLASVKKCLADFESKGFDKNEINACGISNQRETFVVWDKEGKPLYNAVVWQCKRSLAICERLKAEGRETIIKQKTGLIIDPYFSATKLIWLNENDKAVNEAIKSGNACFGTVDTWLLYKLSGGKTYLTDHTNASRTLLFNLQTLQWDNEVIELLGLTGIQLPGIQSSSAFYANTGFEGQLETPIPITGMIGDSHAAAFGEGCFEPGTAKATLGTGCSILMNIGDQPVHSKNGMVTTICWSTEDRIDYALEGVIVSCGSTIEWLKNELHLFNDSKETEAMANAVPDNGGVYLVPAFSGLGSPHWQMDRKASISGMSFGTTKNHIVRAALESIAYQVMDVVKAMEKDAGLPLKELMINGGMTANRFVMQLIADLLNIPVKSGAVADVSALGAAYMAGLQAGTFENIDALKKLSDHSKIFIPSKEVTIVNRNYKTWQNEIQQFSELKK